MKTLNLFMGGMALLADITSADDQCMYCKNMDTNAGFLYSYSYCVTSGECVADQWDKMNAWCDGGWVRGYTLDLDLDCNAEEVVYTGSSGEDIPCLVFNSASIMKGQNFTSTETLKPNQVCRAAIDASQFIAHAMFLADESTNSYEEVGI